MAVQYKDYYDILGVSKDASKNEIQRAYRKLARKFHPDLNKEAGSEERFKEINEAYEVLKDPAKREKYDQVGSGWQQGNGFQPPPGWQHASDFSQGRQGAQEAFFWGSGDGEYSDFFETLFGGRFQDNFQGAGGEPFSIKRRGSDHEAVLRISLEEAFHGGTKSITLQSSGPGIDGSPGSRDKRYDVKIPAGIRSGQKIRLSGQGGRGSGGGGSGDLYLKVEIEPHPRFRLEGNDLYTELDISPWEAALGAKIDVQTLGKPVALKIPSGTQSGQKLRLRAKGMPNPKGPRGDLYAVVRIKVPKRLTKKERQLFEELSKVSSFNPR